MQAMQFAHYSQGCGTIVSWWCFMKLRSLIWIFPSLSLSFLESNSLMAYEKPKNKNKNKKPLPTRLNLLGYVEV